jgi:hypothetical protein
MTGQQPHEVAERRDGFELRCYPAHLVAEIEVEGSFDEAPDRAFRPLAGFINGANRTRRQIAMTAPITQQEAGPEKIAMTAPVMQLGTGRPGSYLVQFVMPSHFTTQTLPAPDDARVRTREIPQQLAAAVRFSGRRTRDGFEERAAALRQAVVAAGLRPAGPVRYARFNPPWTPWFLAGTRSCHPSRNNRRIAARSRAKAKKDTASAHVPLQATRQPGPAKRDTSDHATLRGGAQAGHRRRLLHLDRGSSRNRADLAGRHHLVRTGRGGWAVAAPAGHALQADHCPAGGGFCARSAGPAGPAGPVCDLDCDAARPACLPARLKPPGCVPGPVHVAGRFDLPLRCAGSQPAAPMYARRWRR